MPWRLCRLLLPQEFPHRMLFSLFIQQISNIPLAVVHHQRIVLIAVSRLHTVNRRTLHYRTQGKPAVFCCLDFLYGGE